MIIQAQKDTLAIPDTYMKIETPRALADAVNGLFAIAVYGKFTEAEKSQMQALLKESGESCELVFLEKPTLSAPREALLYIENLSPRCMQMLLRQLYNVDSLICGLLTAQLLNK